MVCTVELRGSLSARSSQPVFPQQRWTEAEERRGSPAQRCPLSSDTCCWLVADIEDTVWLCLCTSMCLCMWISQRERQRRNCSLAHAFLLVWRIRTFSAWVFTSVTEEEGGHTGTGQRGVFRGSCTSHVSIVTDTTPFTFYTLHWHHMKSICSMWDDLEKLWGHLIQWS